MRNIAFPNNNRTCLAFFKHASVFRIGKKAYFSVLGAASDPAFDLQFPSERGEVLFCPDESGHEGDLLASPVPPVYRHGKPLGCRRKRVGLLFRRFFISEIRVGRIYHPEPFFPVVVCHLSMLFPANIGTVSEINYTFAVGLPSTAARIASYNVRV